MPTTDLVPARVDKQDAARAFAEWEATPEDSQDPSSLTKLSTTLGVSRETLHRWRQEAWLQNMVRKKVLSRLASHRAEVYDTLAELAKSGDLNAIRLYTDLIGDNVKQVDVTTGGEKINKKEARTMSTRELVEELLQEKSDSRVLENILEDSDLSEQELVELVSELLDA